MRDNVNCLINKYSCEINKNKVTSNIRAFNRGEGLKLIDSDAEVLVIAHSSLYDVITAHVPPQFILSLF